MNDSKNKTRLDLECTCQLCGLVFNIIGIDKYDLGTLACPTCGKKNIKFTLRGMAEGSLKLLKEAGKR